MTAKVKRIDRRPELMRSLDTATGKALKQAALLCQAIARQLVSKQYTGPSREERDRKNRRARERRAELKERARLKKEQEAGGET